MKLNSIIVLVLIAVAIATIISSYGDASTYVTFAEASDKPSKEFHVVGELNRDKEMYYNPQEDANRFEFFMIDEDGKECKVTYTDPKPQDFERSDKIVIIGKMAAENDFRASKILLKCPSKYNEGNPEAEAS